MSTSNQDAPIPEVLKEYVRNPLPEEFTVEIFEDLHAVIDEHLVEIGRQRGSKDPEDVLIEDWEKTFHQKIEDRRQRMHKDHGALLPFAFVAGEMKMEFLVKAGHPEYQEGQVPDGVIEVMQEFVEIVTYRAEIEGES
jgi:hypothetical protein